MNKILIALKFAADENNVKLFKVGAKASHHVLMSAVDDVHALAKQITGGSRGAGIAILNLLLPKTAEAVKEQMKNVDAVERAVYDNPSDGKIYAAKVTGSSDGKTFCEVNVGKKTHVVVLDEEVPEGTKVVSLKCIEFWDDAWMIV